MEYSNQVRKGGKPGQERSRRLEECSGEGHARAHTHAQVSEIGAATACEPELQTVHITDNATKNQSSRSSWPDAPGKELFTILDMLDVCSRNDGGSQRGEKGSATCVVSAVGEHLRA